MIERRHLINRAIHGWGVVYGYRIAAVAQDAYKGSRSGCLKIGAGLALDPCGRELAQSEAWIKFDDVIVLDKVDENRVRIISKNEFNNWYAANRSPQTRWLLSAHYAEQKTNAVTIKDPCRCEQHEWDHTCETVRYSLQRIPSAKCCDDFDYELNCDCATGPCCEESGDPGKTQATMPHKRGGCRCLCEHLTGWAPEAEYYPLCEIVEPCAHVWVDVRNGVPLACVDLVRDDCDGWTFGEAVEACGPRRLVKSNDLLFDLIRGCDLTYIKNYGWKPWHRQPASIPFSDFADAFAQASNREAEYITEKFWVEFSRPVRRETVQQDCFVMNIISSETDDNWWETARVPIVRVEMAGKDPLIERATIVVDGRWLRGTVRSDSSRFQNKATRVELEVRGDFIIDCNGQMVDANGNGTPGGTFISTFLVEAAPESGPDRKTEERIKGVS
jgi:hypothetical protein